MFICPIKESKNRGASANRRTTRPVKEGESMKTLPVWSREAWFTGTLDEARKVIRALPSLQTLGTVFGAARAYTEVEARAIASAVASRRSAKEGRHAVN
jgi:hypothetical protein